MTLLGETPEQVARAQRELVRIGIDRPAAAAAGRPEQWSGARPLARLRRATFADLAAVGQGGGKGWDGGKGWEGGRLILLDVRRRLEWERGHVAGAIHIPFSDLPGRAGELPPGEVWVYCQSGYRATVAASILAARGREVISVDEDFGRAGPAGLTLASGGAPAAEA